MGPDSQINTIFKATDNIELFDGSAIRRDLSALARQGSDKQKLRDGALQLIRGSFNAARNQIRERVEAARLLQQRRYQEQRYSLNAHAPGTLLRAEHLIDREALAVLLKLGEQAQLSARAFDRTLRVARTIADLARHERTSADDIAEAYTYRTRSLVSR
jgi:predicted ATPase with chaperone activity